MTSDDIKRSISMTEILGKYGIEVRHNMCSCPFHGKDRHPSMQIFRDGYKCHTCGRSGDIFSFVMEMEGVGFRDAFLSLGGAYEKHKSERSRIVAKTRISGRKAVQKASSDKYQPNMELVRLMGDTIDWCKEIQEDDKVYSDRWCYAVNSRITLEYLYDTVILSGDKNGEYDTYRKCRQIRERLNQRS